MKITALREDGHRICGSTEVFGAGFRFSPIFMQLFLPDCI